MVWVAGLCWDRAVRGERVVVSVCEAASQLLFAQV